MTEEPCGKIAPRRASMPIDECGCTLPSGHAGHHIYDSEDDGDIAWRVDIGCECDCCTSDEPDDWCVEWWIVSKTKGGGA